MKRKQFKHFRWFFNVRSGTETLSCQNEFNLRDKKLNLISKTWYFTPLKTRHNATQEWSIASFQILDPFENFRNFRPSMSSLKVRVILLNP